MTIYVNDDVKDAAINLIVATAPNVTLLTAFSSNYATVIGDSFGEYAPTIALADNEGAGGGRKGTLQAASNVTIDTTTNHSGNDVVFTHFAIVDSAGSRVLYVGEGTNKTLSDTDKVNTPAAALRVLDGVVTP